MARTTSSKAIEMIEELASELKSITKDNKIAITTYQNEIASIMNENFRALQKWTKIIESLCDANRALLDVIESDAINRSRQP